MSNTINDTPPGYAIHGNDASEISECADNVLAIDKFYQTLILTLVGTLQDPPTDKLAARWIIEDAKKVQDVGDIVTGRFKSLRLINGYRCTLPT